MCLLLFATNLGCTMLASLLWSNRPYADSRAAGSSHSPHIKIGCWLEKGWQINSQFLDHKAAGNVSEYNGESRGAVENRPL